ncbi:9672_t:CDS:1, partial [Entrophospora sp. SA101]
KNEGNEETPIINLHPALPGQFDGANAIERAYEAFKKGEINKTGVMVHKVIVDVDKGQPLLIEEVPILDSDTLNDLESRIHSVEHRLI